MRTTIRASLLTMCMATLLIAGACSGGGTPVTAGPGPDLSNYSSSISGVIFKDGSPVGSGQVLAFDLESLGLFNQVKINGDGSYAIGADAGQYLIVPVTPTAWKKPILTETFSNYVNIGDRNDYRMDIQLTNIIASGEELVFGFVRSSENGFPIVGATVSAGDRSTRTDAYGFYEMTVPTGTGTFKISANGFNDMTKIVREAQVDAGYFQTPFFDLNPTNKIGGSIGGIVRDVSDGTGLGGVRRTISMPGEPFFEPVSYLTNLGGSYRFYNLAEGIYRLFFERPGYISATRDGYVLKDQDDAIINIFLGINSEEKASVSGFVRNSGVPLPVSGARVSVANPLLGSQNATTGPTGSYSLTGLVPGDYTVTVTAPGAGVTFYEASSTFQTLFSGQNTLDFALRFINEGVLRGTVTLSEPGGGSYAYPPTGVEVTAEKLGGQLSGVKWKTNSDGKGQFAFNGLPAGSYIVMGAIDFSMEGTFFGMEPDVAVNAGTTTNIVLELSLN